MSTIAMIDIENNPYATSASAPEAIGVLSGTSEDLKKVARYQKGIITCIALNLLAIVGMLTVDPNFYIVFELIALVAMFVGAIFVFMLSINVFGISLGIIFGVLCLIPFFGVFVLLGINGKATSILKQNGISVGLFGAKKSSLEAT
jgi:hypothetical protein